MTDPATCSLCHLPGATLQAGGDVGLCHPDCFTRWDTEAEAYERGQVLFLATIPLPNERRTTRQAA